MKRLAYLGTFVLIALVGAAPMACAQGDPFKIGEDDDPFKVNPKKPPPKPRRPVPPAGQPDPIVDALKPRPGAGPVEMLRSARLLSEIGRADLSKPLLEDLLKRKLVAKTLVEMMDIEGALAVMSLIRDEDLQPEGKTLAVQILAAAHRRSQSPQYINSLITQLATARGQQLEDVIAKLRPSQSTAAPPLIGVLAGPNRGEMHDVVSYVLTQLGDDMVHPLLATLETKDNQLKARIVRVLKYFDRFETIALLVGPYLSPKTDPEVRKQIRIALGRMLKSEPTRSEVLGMLHTYARDYYTGRRFVRPDAEDNAVGWRWDAKSQRPVRVRLRARDVGMVIAARLARDLYEIAPDSESYRMLYLAAALEVDGRLARAGIPQAIVTEQATSEAIKQGPAVLSKLLKSTMASGHLYAARATARLLGEHGTVDILHSDTGRLSPLVRAVKHPDRRLRFAALEAIMKIDPHKAYPGSSYVAEALGFFVGSRGQRKALVLYADAQEAHRLAGMLASAGFQAQSTTSPRAAFKLLTSSPDFELILMGVAFRQPQLGEFLQLLRRDGRTGSLPIGLLVTRDDAAEGHRFAKRDPLVGVMAMPSTSDQVKERIGILLQEIDADPVPLTQRHAETKKALDWIIAITARPQRIYRLRSLDRQVSQALFDPDLATKAIIALSNLGTPAGQKTLVNVASTDALDIKMRRAAAVAFQYSVRRFGLLLETDVLREQYRRYNLSEHKDLATQQVMNGILNAIERKTSVEEKDDPKKPNKKAKAGN